MFGIYFVIVGAIVLMRRKALLPAIDGLQQDRALMMIIGAIELVAGIGLALAYPVVSLSPVGLLSLVGYIMAIEGILYLGGGAFMQKIIRRFNSKRSFILGGIVSIVLGLYLLNYGFALL